MTPPDDIGRDRIRALFESARQSIDDTDPVGESSGESHAAGLGEFVDRLRASNVIDEGDWENIEPEIIAASSPRDLAARLHANGRLSGWQGRMLLTGRTAFFLGRYKLLNLIGSGGMGTVYQARDSELHRIVALKVLSDRLLRDAASVARFRREIRAAAALEHENIVRAYDAGEADDVHYFVMEYVQGTDLASLVKANGPLAARVAAGCIRQAAAGMEYAHSKGIIHRDIKPANLLLDGSGTVKILDMGLAHVESGVDLATQTNLTGTNMVMGTVDYMSPEQALDTKQADARSDIYSLGCTLFMLLTGRAMYDDGTPMKKLLAHRESEVPSLMSTVQIADSENGTPALMELQTVYRRMVAKEPAKRYQTMAEVVDALRAVARPEAEHSVTMLADNSLRDATPSSPGQPVGETTSVGVLDNALPDAELQSRESRPMGRRGLIAGGGAIVCLSLLLVLWGAGMFSEKPPEGSVAGTNGGHANTGKTAAVVAKAPLTATQAAAHQAAWARRLGREIETTNSIGMKLRIIPPGEFRMGSPDTDRSASQDEKPQHPVRISRPCLMSTFEVTYGEFHNFVEATGHKTDAEKSGSGHGVVGREIVQGSQFTWKNTGSGQSQWSPVVNVSWNDANAFCAWLSKKEGVTYRLPTEAEWEFACRAGTTSRFSFGDDAEVLGEYGWYGLRPNTVGLKKPNPFGLYDMYGNVAEWCADGYAEYSRELTIDPLAVGEDRIQRGGGFDSQPMQFGSARRRGRPPAAANCNTGFRVVRVLPD
ncbi:MAG: bifunctional serine/threonine-protein kinase/formylglycine-generating enzyme family protein [Planctomycetaceae bacterium]